MAKKKALKLCFDNFMSIYDDDEFTNLDLLRLYHYTHKENYNVITKSEKTIDLRFTRAKKFLDKNEGLSILEPYYHACGYLYDQGIIDDYDFFKQLRSIKPCHLRKHLNPWILCFSMNGASSFMKERYSARDGRQIGILFHPLRNHVLDHEAFQIIKVMYSFEKMKEKLQDIIEIILSECRKQLDNYNKQTLFCQARQLMIEVLRKYCFYYKDESYCKEEEVRMLFDPKQNTDKHNRAGTEETGITMKKDRTCKLYLQIDKNLVYSDETELDCLLTSKLNKTVTTSQEIREVLREHK